MITGVLQASTPPKDGIRVATYNIRYAAEADEQTGNGWNIRKGPLSQLIKRHGFDIIGTQEGNSNQLNDLKGLLPAFDIVAHPYGGKGDLHNVAILYRKNLVEPVASGVFWLSETPDYPSIGWDADDRRICQWAKFKEKQSGNEFYVFNTHFYWRKQTARQNSGPLLAEKISQIAGNAAFVVVTGDFNSLPATSQIQALKGLLKDCHDVTETTREGAEGTGFPGGVFQGDPGGRIDYVFVSPQIRVLDYKVLSDTYGQKRYPSDHLPVTSFLKF